MNIRISKKHKIKVSGTTDIVSIMQEILLRENKRGRNKEHFWCVGLANDNRILYIELVALGTVNSAMVNPSEVLELASIKSAVKLILVHNHPSGTLIPTVEDKNITDRLIQAANLLNKEILDHIIISTNNFYSFASQGLFEELKQSKQFVLPYQLEEMGEKRGKRIGLKEGKKIGLKEGKKEMAKGMKQKGIDPQTIKEISGLSIKEIQKL